MTNYFFKPSPFLAPGPFVARLEGFVVVDEPGAYSFEAAGRGGVKIVLDGAELLDGTASPERAVTGKAVLQAGAHAFRAV